MIDVVGQLINDHQEGLSIGGNQITQLKSEIEEIKKDLQKSKEMTTKSGNEKINKD